MGIELSREAKKELIPWLEDVAHHWEHYWKAQPESRYGKDFAAFVGERLLHDLHPEATAIKRKARG